MNRDLLPIGSIVVLKGGNRKGMIVGRAQKSIDSGNYFDYSACLYPEGVLDSHKLVLFNQDQIESIHYIGFQDKEALDYQKVLNEKIDEINNQ